MIVYSTYRAHFLCPLHLPIRSPLLPLFISVSSFGLLEVLKFSVRPALTAIPSDLAGCPQKGRVDESTLIRDTQRVPPAAKKNKRWQDYHLSAVTLYWHVKGSRGVDETDIPHTLYKWYAVGPLWHLSPAGPLHQRLISGMISPVCPSDMYRHLWWPQTTIMLMLHHLTPFIINFNPGLYISLCTSVHSFHLVPPNCPSASAELISCQS